VAAVPGRRSRKANVLFLNAEDALDDTLRPRLDAAGADLGRVFCLGGVQVTDHQARLLSAPYQLPCDRQMVNKIAGMRRDGFWASP